jgi:GntR family transcriptional regulator
VTLVTLRQALRRLEDDGLVSQQPGRGTFVAEPRATYRLDSLRGLAEDLRAQGQTVTTDILGQALRKAPAGLSGRALRLERVRLLAGRPAVHQLSWVPGAAGAALATVDLSDSSLYAALADLGVVVHRASEVVRPAVLDESMAAVLRRPAGTPVFVSERITYGLDDAAIVLDRATILGSAMEIRTERSAIGLSMQWHRQAVSGS